MGCIGSMLLVGLLVLAAGCPRAECDDHRGPAPALPPGFHLRSGQVELFLEEGAEPVVEELLEAALIQPNSTPIRNAQTEPLDSELTLDLGRSQFSDTVKAYLRITFPDLRDEPVPLSPTDVALFMDAASGESWCSTAHEVVPTLEVVEAAGDRADYPYLVTYDFVRILRLRVESPPALREGFLQTDGTRCEQFLGMNLTAELTQDESDYRQRPPRINHCY